MKGLAMLNSLIVLAAWCVLAGSAIASPAAAQPSLVKTASQDSDWAALSGPQQRTLAPLASQWHTLDSTSRDKWVNVADRFADLPPVEQQRMQNRMKQWAQLPPQQRGEARLRFQNTRQLTPAERQQSWAAYQALSPDERQDLAQQARRKQKPVVLPATEPGPREAAQQTAGPRKSDRKANLVPNTLHGSGAPEVVAPTVVKAGRGATTTLVTQTPRPPLHQQAGLPKINAAKGFVDQQTLLPRKGVQGAGMTPPPQRVQGDDPLAR